MLEVKDLWKRFKIPKKGIVEAVKGASFTVTPGRIFGLLGPNGAGKTTTLRTIATIFSPSKGDILYKGKSIFDDKLAHRKRLGFISGNTGVYDRLYPEEVAKYFGKLNLVEDHLIKSRFKEIVEMLNMGDILKSRCGKLSTGEKQKVSIARMLINDPEILILDEPTNGLDVISSRTIVNFIKESKGKGKTLVLSTHILSEAEYLCDDVGIMHKGEMLYSGDLKELRSSYKEIPLESVFFKLVGEEI